MLGARDRLAGASGLVRCGSRFSPFGRVARDLTAKWDGGAITIPETNTLWFEYPFGCLGRIIALVASAQSWM